MKILPDYLIQYMPELEEALEELRLSVIDHAYELLKSLDLDELTSDDIRQKLELYGVKVSNMSNEWLPNGRFYRLYPSIKHNRTRQNAIRSIAKSGGQFEGLWSDDFNNKSTYNFNSISVARHYELESDSDGYFYVSGDTTKNAKGKIISSAATALSTDILINQALPAGYTYLYIPWPRPVYPGDAGYFYNVNMLAYDRLQYADDCDHLWIKVIGDTYVCNENSDQNRYCCVYFMAEYKYSSSQYGEYHLFDDTIAGDVEFNNDTYIADGWEEKYHSGDIIWFYRAANSKSQRYFRKFDYKEYKYGSSPDSCENDFTAVEGDIEFKEFMDSSVPASTYYKWDSGVGTPWHTPYWFDYHYMNNVEKSNPTEHEYSVDGIEIQNHSHNGGGSWPVVEYGLYYDEDDYIIDDPSGAVSYKLCDVCKELNDSNSTFPTKCYLVDRIKTTVPNRSQIFTPSTPSEPDSDGNLYATIDENFIRGKVYQELPKPGPYKSSHLYRDALRIREKLNHIKTYRPFWNESTPWAAMINHSASSDLSPSSPINHSLYYWFTLDTKESRPDLSDLSNTYNEGIVKDNKPPVSEVTFTSYRRPTGRKLDPFYILYTVAADNPTLSQGDNAELSPIYPFDNGLYELGGTDNNYFDGSTQYELYSLNSDNDGEQIERSAEAYLIGCPSTEGLYVEFVNQAQLRSFGQYDFNYVTFKKSDIYTMWLSADKRNRSISADYGILYNRRGTDEVFLYGNNTKAFAFEIIGYYNEDGTRVNYNNTPEIKCLILQSAGEDPVSNYILVTSKIESVPTTYRDIEVQVPEYSEETYYVTENVELQSTQTVVDYNLHTQISYELTQWSASLDSADISIVQGIGRDYTDYAVFRSESNYNIANASAELKVTIFCDDVFPFSFKVRNDSETGYDYINVYLDGSNIQSMMNDSSWKDISLTLAAGTHEITVNYHKDGSANNGTDRGYFAIKREIMGSLNEEIPWTEYVYKYITTSTHEETVTTIVPTTVERTRTVVNYHTEIQLVIDRQGVPTEAAYVKFKVSMSDGVTPSAQVINVFAYRDDTGYFQTQILPELGLVVVDGEYLSISKFYEEGYRFDAIGNSSTGSKIASSYISNWIDTHQICEPAEEQKSLINFVSATEDYPGEQVPGIDFVDKDGSMFAGSRDPTLIEIPNTIGFVNKVGSMLDGGATLNVINYNDPLVVIPKGGEAIDGIKQLNLIDYSNSAIFILPKTPDT